MLAIIKGILAALAALPQSKKVLAAILTFVVARLTPGLSEEVRMQIVGLGASVILGFAAADHGKEAAKLSPSLAPTVKVPSVSGGVPQAVDPEDPVKDRR